MFCTKFQPISFILAFRLLNLLENSNPIVILTLTPVYLALKSTANILFFITKLQ